MYDILVKYKDALEQGKSARTVQFDSKDEQKIAKETVLADQQTSDVRMQRGRSKCCYRQ